MAGHISEVTWDTASDSVNRRLKKLVEFLMLADNEFQELVQLWAFHSNDDQAVADQLFGGTATPEQLVKVLDLKAAMQEVNRLVGVADMSKLRKMT